MGRLHENHGSEPQPSFQGGRGCHGAGDTQFRSQTLGLHQPHTNKDRWRFLSSPPLPAKTYNPTGLPQPQRHVPLSSPTLPSVSTLSVLSVTHASLRVIFQACLQIPVTFY